MNMIETPPSSMCLQIRKSLSVVRKSLMFLASARSQANSRLGQEKKDNCVGEPRLKARTFRGILISWISAFSSLLSPRDLLNCADRYTSLSATISTLGHAVMQFMPVGVGRRR
jgi:hypothetical protein